MKHDFENGKYTVELVGGELRALRYGERWRDFTGDKLIYLMLAEIDELRTKTQAQPVAAPTPPVQQDDEVLEVLRALVEALENAFISSWQSTAAWQEQLDSARALLTKRGAA